VPEVADEGVHGPSFRSPLAPLPGGQALGRCVAQDVADRADPEPGEAGHSVAAARLTVEVAEHLGHPEAGRVPEPGGRGAEGEPLGPLRHGAVAIDPLGASRAHGSFTRRLWRAARTRRAMRSVSAIATRRPRPVSR